MFNSRSIPTELWANARDRLIFYFSRRLGVQNAEDLAHNTLMAIWVREDYEFEREDDFLKVCYGFAKKILHEVLREDRKNRWIELNFDIEERSLGVKGLKGPEAPAFLEEVRRCGQEKLDAEEWALIEAIVNRDQEDAPPVGRIRTQIHRTRRKLASITGWEMKGNNR